MRRYFLYIIISMVTIVLCGCSVTVGNSDDSYVNDLCAEIVRCFDEEDVDGLERLFCENSRNSNDLVTQIQEAFDKYEGQSTSQYRLYDTSWAGGKRDGIWVDKHYSPQIKELVTSDGKEYLISFYTYEIFESDSGKIGIGALGLYDDEGNLLASIAR